MMASSGRRKQPSEPKALEGMDFSGSEREGAAFAGIGTFGAACPAAGMQ
jgi:hypothetical protein